MPPCMSSLGSSTVLSACCLTNKRSAAGRAGVGEAHAAGQRTPPHLQGQAGTHAPAPGPRPAAPPLLPQLQAHQAELERHGAVPLHMLLGPRPPAPRECVMETDPLAPAAHAAGPAPAGDVEGPFRPRAEAQGSAPAAQGSVGDSAGPSSSPERGRHPDARHPDGRHAHTQRPRHGGAGAARQGVHRGARDVVCSGPRGAALQAAQRAGAAEAARACAVSNNVGPAPPRRPQHWHGAHASGAHRCCVL